MKWKLISIPLLMIMSIILVGCHSHWDLEMENGEVYLSTTDSIFNLKEWNFYPNELLELSDIQSNLYRPNQIYVPGYWEKDIRYGTYHIRAHYSELAVGSPQAVKLPQVFSAYKLWLNDQIILENGVVAETKKGETPSGIPKIVFFTVTEPTLDIILQVSSFDNRNGGMYDPIHIGDPNLLVNHDKSFVILDWFSLGVITIIGLFFITLYWYQRKNKVFFYFGLFCICIGIRMLFVGELYIYRYIPTINWEVVQKINYLTIFIIMSLLIKYLTLLYKENMMGKRIMQITLIISSICILFIIFSTGELYTNTVFFQYILFALIIGYTIYIKYKSIINKDVGARINALFLILLFATAINDFLYNEQIIETMILLPVGISAYCGSQAYVLAIKYSDVNTKVSILNEELELTQHEVMYNLGQIIEKRSNETGNHVKRVAEYSKLLAEKYGLSNQEVEKITLASVLHDVGKIGIPDSILQKPGSLTEEEFNIIKTHTSIGYDLLKHSNRELMKAAAVIAHTHHERFDGTGYPRGLKGENIPLYGRIVALADVFDALSSDRVYKKAWDIDKIITYFKEQKGKQFDPKLVELFLENVNEFIRIRKTY